VYLVPKTGNQVRDSQPHGFLNHRFTHFQMWCLYVQERYGETYCLSFETWAKLMKILAPKQSQQQVRMLFQVMDSDGDGRLSE